MQAVEKELAYLSKLYAAFSPSIPTLIPSPPFPTPRELSYASTQEFLVNLIEQDKSSEPSIWKKLFWRRVVKGIEEGFQSRSKDEDIEDEEVREEILEELVRQMKVVMGSPSECVRNYQWGELLKRESWISVKLCEESKMISSGTTGLRTWQAGLFLCNHIIADPSLISSSTSPESPILELGSGSGLLTIVLSKLSRRKIVGTDVDDVVIERLNQNVVMNSLQDRIQITRLDWEIAIGSDALEKMLEWEVKTFGSSENRPLLILGSDITYDPVLAEPLVATLLFLLRPLTENVRSNVNPEAYIAITIRVESTFKRFLKICEGKGLLVVEMKIMTLGENGIVGCENWENEGEVKLIRISINNHQ